jgi:hypothetical protein
MTGLDETFLTFLEFAFSDVVIFSLNSYPIYLREIAFLGARI